MRTFIIGSAIVLLTAHAGSVSAQYQNAGTVSYQHLLLQYGARGAGLGGSGCALPGKIGMVTVNPAAVASGSGSQGFVGYQNMGLGVWGSVLSYSRLTSFGTIAFSMQGLSSGDIEVIGVKNENPVHTDQVAHIEYLTPSVTVSRAFLQNRVLVGASLKGMYQRIDNPPEIFSSKAAGFDVGVQYRQFGNRFVAAAVVRNVGFEFQSFTGEELYGIPSVFEAGVSYIPRYMPNVRLVADVNKSRGAYVMYEPGFEIELYPGVFVARAGYPFSQRDLEEWMKSFSGEEKDQTYVRNNLNTFACGVGITTSVQKRAVAIDVSAQFKDNFYPPTVVLSSEVDF